jgi:predicted nucleic acid-binding protein
MTEYVFDTNIMSWIIGLDESVIQRMNETVKPADSILLCPVVWYEVRRGLLAKDARNQINRADIIFSTFMWQDYTQNDWAVAAVLWTHRRQLGLPISDADLLIAVFARNRNAVLVTDNEKDFAQLGVTVENWKK